MGVSRPLVLNIALIRLTVLLFHFKKTLIAFNYTMRNKDMGLLRKSNVCKGKPRTNKTIDTSQAASYNVKISRSIYRLARNLAPGMGTATEPWMQSTKRGS